MAEKYLTEAFQELSILEEDVFNITDDGIAQANDFVNNTEEENTELVIDPLATTEEELQDSYIGKVILDCTICQSKIYMDASEVTLNEDESLANVGEVCPYCQSSDGYKVIGQVAPFAEASEPEVTADDEVSVETEEKVEEACKTEECKEDEEELDEGIASKKGKRKLASMKEDLNNVQVETDNDIITISAEPKTEEPVTTDEMIAPLEPETEAEFGNEGAEELEDVEFDEFDENGFDNLGERYLRRVYENVASYKTVSGAIKGNKLKLEGIVEFKSGKKSKTNFVFESHIKTNKGKLKFTGLNEQFAKGKKTYTLTARLDGNKLVAESLAYNYRGKDVSTGTSKRIYGRVINR